MSEIKTTAWIVGAPGVGKTTAVRSLLNQQFGAVLVPKPKWTLAGPLALAGHYTGDTFDGADTVPYTGVQDALDYWERQLLPKHALTIFDGDRFSHASAVERVELALTRLTAGDGSRARLLCVHLVADEDALETRRRARGSNQNPAWMRGRATKAARFAESFETLDAKPREAPRRQRMTLRNATPQGTALLLESILRETGA